MKQTSLLITLLFIPLFSFSQLGWTSLNCVPSNMQRFEDVYFINKDTGFAVEFGGYMYKTTDAGVSWSSNYFFGPVNFRSIEFLDDGVTGLAGSFVDKVFRTPDGGITWTDISTSFTNIGSHPRTICGIAHYGNIFYAMGWWGADTAKIFKSTDKGLTWTTTIMDPAVVTNLVDGVFLSADTGFVTGGKNTSSNPNSSNQAVILKTTDGGSTWTKVFADSVIGGRIWKIQALNHRVLVASIEPYYSDTVAMIKSTDGGNTWVEIGTGFSAPHLPNQSQPYGQTQGIGFVKEYLGWLGGWYNGAYETYDTGKTWHYLTFGINLNRFFIIDSVHAFAGGQQMYKYLGVATTSNQVAPQAIKMPHDLYPISPNPAKGNVKIEFDLKTETNVVLEVASIDTRHVTRIVSARMKPGHYTYNWDGRNAPNGHYMVWLGTDEIPIVEKFVLDR